MKDYDPNLQGTLDHTVEITVQQWAFKGVITITVGGNIKGASVIEMATDFDMINSNFVSSDCEFKLDEFGGEDGEILRFSCMLHNEKDDAIEFEENFDDFANMVVGINIVDCVRRAL